MKPPLSPLTAFLGMLALLAPLLAYASYPEDAPPATEVLEEVVSGYAGEERGLGRAVSSALYSSRPLKVEGPPERGPMGMMISVAGYIVMPAPGVWEAEGLGLLRPPEVLALLARADYVEVEGYRASWYMGPHGRVDVVVAYEIEATVGGVEVELELASSWWDDDYHEHEWEWEEDEDDWWERWMPMHGRGGPMR